MPVRLPSPYALKKWALSPYTFYMRRRERETSGFIKSALELHYYRPAFYRFVQAKIERPGILHEHPLDEGSVVVDVGAYTGEWAQEIGSRYDSTIYAFEPNPQSYSELLEKSRELPGLRPLAYGLGAVSETVNISMRGLGSSIFESRAIDRSGDREEVSIVAIDEAFRSLDLEHVDLMKINIEGAEFPLLERMMDCDLLRRVDCFMIQFHEWHPGAYRRRRHIRRALSKTHSLDWDYHFVWEKWSRR